MSPMVVLNRYKNLKAEIKIGKVAGTLYSLSSNG